MDQFVLTATAESAQEQLFDPDVTFKFSRETTEIEFERQFLFGVLLQSEVADVEKYQCFLTQNGSHVEIYKVI